MLTLDQTNSIPRMSIFIHMKNIVKNNDKSSRGSLDYFVKQIIIDPIWEPTWSSW